MFWDFHIADIDFGASCNHRFLVRFTQRVSTEGQRSSYKQQATVQLLQENHPLASFEASEDEQDVARSDASSWFPHMLTDRFFAVAQQLPSTPSVG